MASRATAEEFYSRCLNNVTVLDGAARRFADAEDVLGALASVWGADLYALQAVVWERILVASSFPQRQYFRAAEALLGGLAAALGGDGDPRSAAEVLTRARAGLIDACDPALRHHVEAAWRDPGYLAGLPAPTSSDLQAWVDDRAGGLGLSSFAAKRRADAAVALNEAQNLRVKGDSVGAIQAAYDADLLALEAYLVDSAVASGDGYLLTVTIRWELATNAVATLPGLPDGFVAAVARIREALSAGLGDADGARFQETLVQV